ncbi:uncharacterized protein N7484_010956 [Penicillium longicatenatum]|uniref:uncharacterized protein n=1 Tax=Penicillium longicatenatum TaxID=1561947 RepID=UPI002546CFEB|nr:uncharacterized protein N7484_010956 [Penicillium longicatenatum]KAJ5630856.1 hypothetical protein N7484_010956 [Penicillium longicatenatum]
MWASLGDEIEELRDILNEPEGPDDSDDIANNGSSPSSALIDENSAVMGLQTTPQSLYMYHPQPSQAATLFEIFKENIVPLVHIFHIPTLIPVCWRAFTSPETLDCNTEALMFAIYYSAVISMDNKQCEDFLGLSRAAAVNHYHFAMKHAIARANILNTQSTALLQAVVLFLSALRNEDASRTCWSLTALMFHAARAMGLHRDGTEFSLSPLETELRRRLWWHICLLDIRSAEYHGFEPIAQEYMFDTRVPLNINDSDLTTELKDFPIEHEGTTEMTYCLIRCEVLRVMWKTGYVQFCRENTSKKHSFLRRASLVNDLKRTLEEKYLIYCDRSIPFHKVCETVAQLTIARTWLVLYYPLVQQGNHRDLIPGIRDKLFFTSLKILELSQGLLTDPQISHFSWHSQTHVQWHAVAFLLSEICLRPPSNDCDRAWGYIQTVYEGWKLKKNKGDVWLPITRLVAKASDAREIGKMCDFVPLTNLAATGYSGGSLDTLGFEFPAVSHSAADTFPACEKIGREVSEQKDVSSADSLDSFFNLFPDNNIFDTISYEPSTLDIESIIRNWAGDFHEAETSMEIEKDE